MRIQLLAAALVFTATAASAQTKPVAPAPVAPVAPTEQPRNQRQGFWIGFGLGDGSAGVDCSSCATDRTSGLSGNLRLGGTLSQSVLLGFESNGWIHSEQGIDETLGFGSAVVVWYPSRTGAFYLKFGLGVMSYTATDGVDDFTATAPAGSFGLGYDFRVGRNMSITPFLNSLATSAASLKLNGTAFPTSEDIKVNLLQFGVGLTWH